MKKIKPNTLIFSGYGLNTEEETKYVFEDAGAVADIIHINDIIARPVLLKKYQIAVLPGGFSYGDDTGGGKAYARLLKRQLGEHIETFLQRDTLFAGICNGFQIATNAGLLPGALISNKIPRYLCRWVDVKVTGESPWLTGIRTMSVPIAHGEGRYYNTGAELDVLEKNGQVALKYFNGPVSKHLGLKANPNGACRDIAGVSAMNGRMLGMMPHPERATRFTQLPHWTYLKVLYEKSDTKVPEIADGFQMFKNAVNYFN